MPTIPNFPVVTPGGDRIPNCSMPIQESFKPYTVSITFDSGHEQRRKKGPTVAVFQLTYNVLTDEQYKTIRQFFLDNTDVVSFLWIHPQLKTTYKCKFDSSSFSGSNFGHNGKTALWSLKFTLQEVV